MRQYFSHAGLIALISLNIIVLADSSAVAAKVEELIPNESIVYLTLRDLEDVWWAIEESENWKEVFAQPSLKSRIDGINQGMQMVRLLLNIDFQGLLEIFGYQVVLTVFPGDTEPMIGVIVNTGGAMREVERIIDILIQMVANNEGNRVQVNEGVYRNIAYSAVEINSLSLMYGFVDDLLVVGVNTGSFQALIATYRKQRESIRANRQFRKLHKKYGDGQVFAYIAIDGALPLITAYMSDQKQHEFDALGFQSLKTLVYSLDLFSVNGGHHLYAQIKERGREGMLGVLLQEGQPLQSIQALSGKGDFFAAIAPASSEAIWRFIEVAATAADRAGGFNNDIAKLEASLNLDIKNDVVGALTGEIAAWGNFPDELKKIHDVMDLFYGMDATIGAGLKNPLKWQPLLDSVQNIANLSTQQYDYNGTILHQVSLSSNDPTMTLHYGNLKNLFFASGSDKRVEAVVDNVLTGSAMSAFQKRLKKLPATPVFVMRLKLDRFLPAVMRYGKTGSQLSTDALQRIDGMSLLFATISVKAHEAWVEVIILSEDEVIETYGRLASVIAPILVKQEK